jgi:hypothetical protein
MRKFLAPALAAIVALAPSAHAAAPVLRATLSAPAGPAVPLALPSALPAVSVAGPSLAPSRGLVLPLALASAVGAAPLPVAAVAAAAPAAPLPTLRAIERAAPATAALAFDGSAAVKDAEPVRPPEAANAPAAKKSLLQRYRESRRKSSPLQKAFANSLMITAMGAAAAPAIWGAQPALKAAYNLAVADAILFAVIVPAIVAGWAWKKLRAPTAARPPPTRRLKLAVAALGFALGIAAGTVPSAADGPIVQRWEAYQDRSRPAEEVTNTRWLSGGVVQDETVKVLSANPVGREVLERLKDRGGVLRLPPFFISKQKDSHAQHENLFDGVYLSEDNITSRGWTVEQVLKDPALQRKLVYEMRSTILHELVHAAQGRRAPWRKGYFTNTVSIEQEAFLYQTMFIVAELKADPKARNTGHDLWLAPSLAQDFDAFLEEVADMYENNARTGDAGADATIARLRAEWPAYRVEIYRALAARAQGPALAKMYMDKARAAASEAGLPEPKPLD